MRHDAALRVERERPERERERERAAEHVLALARQSAEVAFILGRIVNNDADLSFTSVMQGRQFDGLDDAILNRGRN